MTISGVRDSFRAHLIMFKLIEQGSNRNLQKKLQSPLEALMKDPNTVQARNFFYRKCAVFCVTKI